MAAPKVENLNTLVIVESPAKAKTIQKILPSDRYTVDFCLGHVRDLLKQSQVPKEIKQEDPDAKMGIRVAGGSFIPLYKEIPSKSSIVKRLKSKLKTCQELVLATDEDREGEAISWHLLEVLKPPSATTVRRAVFHEITEGAILEAFASPREVDMNLVAAQETRRMLDRLAGFTMSPLLWSKVAPKLSAGRVQSVGMTFVVQKERARLAHMSVQYSDVSAVLNGVVALIGEGKSSANSQSQAFETKLLKVGERRVAKGTDFSQQGELLSSSDAVHLNTEDAASLVSKLKEPTTVWTVQSVEARQRSRKGPKPLTTSQMQQEANRRLKLGAQATMSAAQKLYEAGIITYMRTDSSQLSETATVAARDQIVEQFGEAYLNGGNSVKEDDKKSKYAQEAHEAIRPAVYDGRFPTPEEIAQHSDVRHQTAAVSLYGLIYRRTLASQMAQSLSNSTTVVVVASEGDHEIASFKASGRTLVFAGFLKAYESMSEQAAKDDDDNDEAALPPLVVDQVLTVKSASGEDSGVLPTVHRTSPPGRYSVGSFIAELEASGVGRPSTYASIVETLQSRGYVTINNGGALIPSLSAFVVTGLLEDYCPQYVEADFTAKMEANLDAIAQGVAQGPAYLSDYFLGIAGLKQAVATMHTTVEASSARRVRLPHLEGDPRLDGVSLFLGPYGVWVERLRRDSATSTEDPLALAEDNNEDATAAAEGELSPFVRAALPVDMCADASSVTATALLALLEAKEAGGILLGQHPDTGREVRLCTGTYGLYIRHGPEKPPEDNKCVSVPFATAFPKGRAADDASAAIVVGAAADVPENASDGSTACMPNLMTLADALDVLALPRVVGPHPDPLREGDGLTVGVGRYGPYVSYKSKVGRRSYVKLPADEDPLTVSHEKCVELVTTAEASSSLGRGVLRSFGPWPVPTTEAETATKAGPEESVASPPKSDEKNSDRKKSDDDSDDEPVLLELRKGRFGAYAKWGPWMASLPSDLEDAIDSLPAEVAWELIERKMEQSAEDPDSKQSRKSAASKKKAKAKPTAAVAAGAKSSSTSKAKTKLKAASSSTTKVPRRSAWLSFCAATRPVLAAEGVDASIGSMTKALSEKWAALDTAGRQPYDDAARELRDADAKTHAAAPGDSLASTKTATKKRSLSSATTVKTNTAGKKKTTSSSKASSKLPKRPVATSAFRVFSQAARPAACEAAGTKQVGPVAKELSRMWAALDEEARGVYESQATEANNARALSSVA